MFEEEKQQLEKEKANLVNNLEPGNQDSITRLNQIDSRLYEINALMEQQQAKQERVQKQEEHKASFVLPDYSAIFGDPRANDEISKLVNQVIDQLNAIHNDDIAGIEATYSNKVQTLTKQGLEAENQLAEQKSQNDHLQVENMTVNETCNKLRTEIDAEKKAHSETKLQLEDATSKRDAAVKEMEYHKNRADELEKAKPPVKVTDKRSYQLNLTSELDAKDTPIKSAKDLVMERFGLTPPAIGGIPEGNSFRTQDQNSGTTSDNVDAGGTNEAQSEVPGENVTFQVSDVQPNDGQETSGGIGQNPGTLEEAFKRIEALEKAVYKEQAA